MQCHQCATYGLMLSIIAFTLSIIPVLSQRSSYIAAVVEYAANESGNHPDEILMKNLANIENIVANASAKNVDIIVFPEYGLTSLNVTLNTSHIYAINVSSSMAVTSTNTPNRDAKIISQLQTLAKRYKVYLVINLIEKLSAPHSHKILYYNTDLVIDRNGQIVAKYHKQNLYNEFDLTPGKEIVTFTTDFGVTFGIFTCFDMMFHNPSQRMFIDFKNITDVIFTTAWFSTLPFYSALTIQQGYAASNGVNLLAANYHKPSNANGGSGFFFANGTLGKTYISEKNETKILVQRIDILKQGRYNRDCCSTKQPQQPVMNQVQSSHLSNGTPKLDDLPTSKFISNDDYLAYPNATFKTLHLQHNLPVVEKICKNDFCCEFNISVVKLAKKMDQYKIMIFEGSIVWSNQSHNIRLCALMPCTGDSNLNQCRPVEDPDVRFSNISLKASIPMHGNAFYRPMTMYSNLQPIEQINYCLNCTHTTNSSAHLQHMFMMAIPNATSNNSVVLFGLFGRYNSTATQSSSTLFMLVLCAILAIFYKLP